MDEFLSCYPELSLRPSRRSSLVVEGAFHFCSVSGGAELEDVYRLRILIPKLFPEQLPSVFDIGERIPRDFHRLADGSFCLGSPLRLQLLLGRSYSILDFVHKCVVPYLHGFSVLEQTGELPFGDLEHGFEGIFDDYKVIFGVDSETKVKKLFYLASKPRSKANRYACPCGSGLRVGKCHNDVLNKLRKTVGRLWFRNQFLWMGIEVPRIKFERKNLSFMN